MSGRVHFSTGLTVDAAVNHSMSVRGPHCAQVCRLTGDKKYRSVRLTGDKKMSGVGALLSLSLWLALLAGIPGCLKRMRGRKIDLKL